MRSWLCLGTLLTASALSACATAPIDDVVDGAPAATGKADDADDRTPGLVELLVESDRAMFAIRCDDHGEFVFKIRGAVVHGGLYPAGWIDATAPDPGVLSSESHTSTTHTMWMTIPDGVFLQVAPQYPDLIALDHPYPVNSQLSFWYGADGLFATGRFAGRDGQWTCSLLAQGSEDWTTLL